MFLELMFPVAVREVGNLPGHERELLAKSLADILASDGDKILYKEEGKTRKAVAALGKAIALGALQPGGVRVFGRHWEAQDALGRPATNQRLSCTLIGGFNEEAGFDLPRVISSMTPQPPPAEAVIPDPPKAEPRSPVGDVPTGKLDL